MADKLLFDSPHIITESEHEIIAENHSDSSQESDGKPATLELPQATSGKRSQQPSTGTQLDNSRPVSSNSHRESSAVDNADFDDRHEISLEERLARDRIKHLHDLFVSSHGAGGLNMEDFRSAMRQAQLKEPDRQMEDSELDKVAYLLESIFLDNSQPHSHAVTNVCL